MKHFRRTCAALLLALALSTAAFAGDMQFPSATDGQMETPRSAGEIGFPGATGDTQFPGVMGDILTPGIRLLFATLM